MVESTVIEESKEYSMMQYFQSNILDIPERFITQFVNNYLHRDTWVRSDYLFEWFAIISPNYKYDDYLKKLRKIVKEVELKDYSDKSSELKHTRRKLYLISQKGMKTFMMSVSEDTREYYVQLDSILEQYLKEQNQELNVQTQQQQQQLTELIELKQQEQDLYQSKLKTQSIKINDIDIQMYGDLENPLFDARQVLIDLLEYKQLEDCRFYKDNKSNPIFINRFNVQQMTGNLPGGSERVLGRNQYTNNTIYLTEFGLYECLFTSNKLIASEFRLQVMQLLKDIRLGNIKLQVQKECQYTDTIKFKSNQIINFITKVSDLEGQVKLLQENDIKHKQMIEQTKKTLTIYEQRVDDKVFVRSTIRARDISNERNSKSPNRHIRKASLENKPITLNIIKREDIVSNDDRKFFVKQHIDTHNRSKLLNERIQKPNLSNVTSLITINRPLREISEIADN